MLTGRQQQRQQHGNSYAVNASHELFRVFSLQSQSYAGIHIPVGECPATDIVLEVESVELAIGTDKPIANISRLQTGGHRCSE
jgi:hypothetical protein